MRTLCWKKKSIAQIEVSENQHCKNQISKKSPDRQGEEAAVVVAIGESPGDAGLSLHHLLLPVLVVEGVVVEPDRGVGAADVRAGAGRGQDCWTRVLG